MKEALALAIVLILAAVVWRGIDVSPTATVAGAEVAEAPTHAPSSPPANTEATHGVARTVPVAVPTSAPASTAPAPVPAPDGDASHLSLSMPVKGKVAADLTDTFTDARSEGRSHDAIDIMAAAGTPVLAVADGHVEKLFTSERGGLTVYQFEPTGRYAYYYAHLQRYAAGLAEKQAIRRGEVIGYVGSTGNASPDAPHLHFAIFMLGPERRWWQGTAINPYPVLIRGQPPTQPPAARAGNGAD